jgi:hypothetical protein
MDKYRDTKKIPLLESRVSQLVGRLNRNTAIGSFNTQEQLTRAFAGLARNFAKGHEKALYDLPKPTHGGALSEEELNLVLTGMYNELLYLFIAGKGTEQLVESNFNFAAARIRKLQAAIKYCRQQLAVYSLYATHFGNDLFFGETFSNAENIDRGSASLSGSGCFLDLQEGTLALPRKDTEDLREINSIQIGESSNVIAGSNVEAGTPLRRNLGAMYDNNTDTWTEFERVVVTEDSEGLKLELKISLNDINVVNGIRIIPVFLGARSPFVITTIKVSEDGSRWIDLKEDVRVAGFLDEVPEDRYHLSPHTARFSGEFSITFAPRFVRFVQLVIKQGSTIPIIDVYGREKLRYAVGIKELSIHGYQYEAQGEIVSKPVSFEREFSVVGIEDLVDPPFLPETVGKAEYFISANDGASWEQLTSLGQASVEIPEVIEVPPGTQSIRYRVRLTKDEAAFAQNIQATLRRPFREVYPVSEIRPLDLTLNRVPIDGTLSVCRPGVATRGKIYPRTLIGRGSVSSLQIHTDGASYYRHGNLEHRLPLPMTEIEEPSTLSIFVNNTEWTQVLNWSGSTAWSQDYMIQRDSVSDRWEIIFGNNSYDSPKGAIPALTDQVSLYITEEQNYLRGLTSPYRMKLEYPSDGEKDNTLIKFHGGYETYFHINLPSGVTKFKLPTGDVAIGTYGGVAYDVYITIKSSSGEHVDLTYTTDLSPPATGTFQNYQSFIDGNIELTNPGDWTVDIEEGWLYTESEIASDQVFYISYAREKIIELVDTEWDFVDGKLDEIQVYESGYHALEETYSLSSTEQKVADITVSGLDIRGLVPKSVRVSNGVLGSYEPFEVPFVDGSEEFRGRARVQDESVPAETAITDVANFRLAHYSNLLPTTAVSFSDTATFVTEKSTLGGLTSVGDFFVDTTGGASLGTGYVYVKLSAVGASIPSGGTVSYQYIDPASRERYRGAFSVDASRGRVHFAEFTSATGTITFKYTPYRARYNISQILREDKDYRYLEESGALRVLPGFTSESGSRLSIQYQYEPEAARTAGLAPSFSPLLRGIALRVA